MTQDTSTTEENRSYRRAFLITAGTTVTGSLAGCTGSGPDGDSEADNGTTNEGNLEDGENGSSESPFGEIAFDGAELTVEIINDAVATVNAFRDNELIGSTDVASGASQVTVFEASQTYRGEEVQLVAADDEGNEIDSTTDSFAANASVTRVRTRAIKNGRPVTEEAVNEYAKEFAIPLVTIENTGDGPLFLHQGRIESKTSVFITDGIPNTCTPEDATVDANRVVVPAGGSTEVTPYIKPSQPFHLYFHPSGGGENDQWPESVRNMGEWSDGYADGDDVELSIAVVDDRGEQFEANLTVTYSGGLYQTGGPARAMFVPGRVTSN